MPPAGAKVVTTGHRSTVKSSVVDIGDAYDTANPGNESLGHYSHSLVQHGWKRHGEGVDQYGQRHVTFCRNDYVARVDVWPEKYELSAKSERRYYFYMRWTSTGLQKSCT